MKIVKWSCRAFAIIAVGVIANAALMQPAQAYWDRGHRWHDRHWGRPSYYQPGYVYSPPPVVYTPPPPSPGINLIVPLNFR